MEFGASSEAGHMFFKHRKAALSEDSFVFFLEKNKNKHIEKQGMDVGKASR